MNSHPITAEISPDTLAAFIGDIPGITWIIDEQGTFLACNKGFCEMVQQESSKIIGKTVKDILGDELAAICLANRKVIVDTGESRKFIQSVPQHSGEIKDYLINEFPLATTQNKLLFGGIGFDITSQLSTESELKESKYRLSRLNRLYGVLSQINEIIVRSSDREQLLLEVCRIIVAKAEIKLAWVGHCDSSTGEVKPMAAYGPHADYVKEVTISTKQGPYSSGPASRALRTGCYATSNDIPTDSTFHLKTAAAANQFQSCGVFPFEYDEENRAILLVYSKEKNYFQNEENRLFQALADDLSYALRSITAKKHAEAAQAQLSDNQRQLATLFSNLPGMAYRCQCDEFWTMDFVSEGCLELTGYQPEDLVGNHILSFEELIHPDDAEWVRQDVGLALSRKTRYELTYRIQHRTKGERWVWERGLGIFGPEGKLRNLEGFISDVTDQQLAYARMRDQAELIDQAHDAIIVCDQAGDILFWNQGATRLYGFSQEQVIGTRIRDVLKTHGERLNDAVREVRRAGEWTGELVRTCADGTEKTVESRWTTVSNPDENDRTILTIDSDITERRNLEKQFLRAQRMESVGNLAGGIAHDLNNILSPIMMSAELLEDIITGEQEQKILSRISDGSRRAADLVQQLLSFSRGLDSSRKPLDISAHAADMRTLVYDAISERVKVDFKVEEALPQIRANPVQLNQVLLNLCLNARDAMDSDGLLTVHIYKNVKTQVPPEIIPGNFVVFEVSDTGSGIPEEMRDQIFEPFFSTKLDAGGTGLGLSSSLSIVQNHGGFIDLSSTLGKGTTFRVFLPALGMRLTSNETPDANPPAHKNKFTLLVVDDESMMRSVLAQTLEKFHYHVETASNGQEALDLIDHRQDPIHLVLTDINMPVLNGIELAHALRDRYPDIKIVAMSGFEQEQTLKNKHDFDNLFDHFLPKPFDSSHLSEVLDTLLS